MVIRCCQIATLLLAALLLVGCSAQPLYGGLDGDRAYHYDGSSRSLALDSTRQTALTAARPPGDAWWVNRRDQGPVAYGGVVGVQRETTVTYTRDTQYISGGRVYDRYQRSTYRRSVQDSFR